LCAEHSPSEQDLQVQGLLVLAGLETAMALEPMLPVVPETAMKLEQLGLAELESAKALVQPSLVERGEVGLK